MGTWNNLRVLRAKWWVVLLASIAGAAIGMVLASNHNSGVTPKWRAEAPVTFIAFAEDGSGAGSQTRNDTSTNPETDALAEAVRARLLLEEALAQDPRLSVRVDRESNVLLFTVTGRDGDATLRQALELRSLYQTLSSDVLNIDQIHETIDALLVDIDSLEARIDLLVVQEPPDEDSSITIARSVLVTEIDTLYERQAQLRIWVLNPELRPTEDDFFGIEPEANNQSDSTETTLPPEPVIVSVEVLEEELGVNTLVIRRLNAQLTEIPDAPVADELALESALALEAMQVEATDLRSQYVELLRIADGRSPGGFFEEPTLADETPPLRPVRIFAFAGALVGALVASVILVGLDRARRTVWAASSLENITCLGVVDRNRSDGNQEAIWYPTSVSQRRRDIQTFRASTDAVTQEQPAIVGFFGVNTASKEVGELAADLATAYSVAGRDVLLIDANAYEPNHLAEFGDRTSSLTKILVQDLAVSEAISAVDELIDTTPQAIPHLTSLHVDAATHDPVDAIASPSSRGFMEFARERFDIVIVAGPAISDPLSDTVARRIDFAILTARAGKTTMPQIETATDILTDRRTATPGVVLLRGRRKSFTAKLVKLLTPARAVAGSMVRTRGTGNEGSAQLEDPAIESTHSSG